MSIEWYQWSGQSFREAGEESRLILLFLGAFWDPATRAVDEKVFSSPKIAKLANEEYIPIRVDLDQRPDIYDRYSTEGWPCMAVLTPRGAPIWVSNTFGDAELLEMLSQLNYAYRERKEAVDQEIEERERKNGVERRKVYQLTCQVNDEIFRKTVRGIMVSFDMDHMGFGDAPKYPHAASLRVLAHAFACVGGADLEENLAGGLQPLQALFDSKEGGFYRFARKKDWSSPMTAKICEENAELIQICLDGGKLLDEPTLRELANATIEWAISNLWDARVARFAGSQAAGEFGSPPPVDPVQFTSGSAAMASAFLQSSVDLDRPDCAKIALQCLDGLWAEGFDSEKGMCSQFAPGPVFAGLARSQISMLGALLDTYEYTGKDVYLERAGTLLSFCRERFWSDEERGILDRLPRADEIGEGMQPRKNLHENALIAESAVRWACLTGKDDLGFPKQVLEAFPDFEGNYGHYTSHYALAADLWLRPATEIDLFDPTDAWKRAALYPFLSRKMLRYHAGEGKPHARVRKGKDFEQLVHSPEELAGLLTGL